MRETGHGARLAEEALAEGLVVRVGRRQHLHRHVALEAIVAGAVHAGHAAPRDERVDAVAVGERAAEHRVRLVGRVGAGRSGAVGHDAPSGCRIEATSARASSMARSTSTSRPSGGRGDRSAALPDRDAQRAVGGRGVGRQRREGPRRGGGRRPRPRCAWPARSIPSRRSSHRSSRATPGA